MGRRQHDVAYVEFVDARRPGLLRTAYLLCGDWHRAEDLVQQALVKLYVAWPRLVVRGTEDAYVRRALVTTNVDEWRWRRRRPETSVAAVRDEAPAPADGADDRDALRRALLDLPAGQRAVLVLRFWLDQSVEQVAADLDVSTGTVKSQTARALQRMRAVLDDQDESYDNAGRNR